MKDDMFLMDLQLFADGGDAGGSDGADAGTGKDNAKDGGNTGTKDGGDGGKTDPARDAEVQKRIDDAVAAAQKKWEKEYQKKAEAAQKEADRLSKLSEDERKKAELDLDVSDVMALVEAEGMDVNGFVAGYDMKNSLRKLRDANGNQLYVDDVNQRTLYAQPIEFSRTDAWDKTKARAIAGDWKYAIVGLRDQIKYETLTEATLQSVTMGDGKPLSLAENDMVAIKATMRLGFLPVKESGRWSSKSM